MCVAGGGGGRRYTRNLCTFPQFCCVPENDLKKNKVYFLKKIKYLQNPKAKNFTMYNLISGRLQVCRAKSHGSRC